MRLSQPLATRPAPPRRIRSAAATAAIAGSLAVAWQGPAAALDFKASGRVTYGAAWRTEAPDPALLNPFNSVAGQAGVVGLATGSANSDDGNINFHRNDAISTVLKGYLDLNASHGSASALLRVKAWRDFALAGQDRQWGNIINDYTPGVPLGDRGAPLLSRFSGIAVSDAYVQDSFVLGGLRLLGRAGQQTIPWGERSGFAGGLEAVNPRDMPALRRPGAVPQETKVAIPALFSRLELTPSVGLEGFWQTGFRPTALDLCGTFWAITDYAVAGCDKVMAGPPASSDRARVQSGAYFKRLPTPSTSGERQYGLALSFKAASIGTEFGLYHAHYTARTATPGLRKSTRVGAPVIPGDPDGKNVAFFTEYVGGINLYAATFVHKRARSALFGELAYRLGQPLQLPAGDATGPFLSLTAPSLLRADADALAPGALFHGYDRYRVAHATLGLQHEWSGAGGRAYSGSAEVVAKHVFDLPDQAVRRYLRPDQFGLGPIGATCNVSSADPVKQCSLNGYVSSDAYAYRLRLDARYNAVLPGLNAAVSAIFVHDVKGWAYDALVNEGRKTLNLALRLDYRQRYVAELVLAPVWGGDYNAGADRDTVALSAGVRF